MRLIEEQLLQGLGDRPGFARADGAAVKFADRCHFGGCAREEGLIGDIDRVAGDAPLLDRITRFTRQRDHRIAGDPRQNVAEIGCVDDAVLHYEQVFTAAFRRAAGRIQHQCLVIARIERLFERHDRIDVVPRRLGSAHDAADAVAGE